MKKLISTIVFSFLLALGVQAIPAHKGKVTITQPDGTTVTLRLHGDEYLHFTTTEDGYSVVKGADNFYRYARREDGKLVATDMVAHDMASRSSAEKAFLNSTEKYQAPDMTEQMQQKMAGYKRPAPEVSWEEIDRVLSANKARKTRLLWLRRMAAAIALLAIAGVGYWSILRHETEQVIEKRVAENHGDGAPEPVILPTQPAVPVIYTRSLHKSGSTTIPVSELETIISVPETVTDTVDIVVMEEKEQSHTVEENAKPIEPTRPVVIYPTDLHQRKHIDNRLMAKVYMSSTIRQAESSSLLKTIDPSGAFGDSTSIVLINQQIHHHQPVRIGLSLRYQLNDCLSVESGLLYTHLSSDITMTDNGVTTTKKQHLILILYRYRWRNSPCIGKCGVFAK